MLSLDISILFSSCGKDDCDTVDISYHTLGTQDRLIPGYIFQVPDTFKSTGVSQDQASCIVDMASFLASVVFGFLGGRKQPTPSPKFDARWKRAQAAWQKSQNHFKSNADSPLQYQRVLGKGGYGMAQLWSVCDALGNHVRDIVVKAPIPKENTTSAEDSIRREIFWLGQVLKNAEHVVQLVDLENPLRIDVDQVYNNRSAETPYLVMETLSRGTLMDLVYSVTEARFWNMDNPDAGDQRKLAYVGRHSPLSFAFQKPPSIVSGTI
ncbi:hypothetical protein GGR52DRAFT_510000 [Hypoxylon sp. FL1284]|nr:hypothetical protein GGR52DRAFT_510000 [Hypoxylon sp. FL1284]